ncbi:MAG: hypothetical protein [Myoviridae sp. ctThM1]|nr:MAG: hypothetical protein [Myoviridae sp. ctThM1]
MTDNLKLLKLTTINGKAELYYDGLIIVDKINSVFFQDAIYRARDNCIVTSTGKKNIIQLVERGLEVYFLS